MKKFLAEFKKFITRGNVVDMAVGVIVGGAFTAIVNGMSNFILKPIINWLLAIILGEGALTDAYSFLDKKLDETGAIDLANSIYIDWGSFINAVINFLLVAFVLFTIVKFVNRFRENRKSFAEKLEQGTLNRAERKEMRAMNLSPRKRADVTTYLAKKAQDEADAKAKAEAEAAEKARAEREANPTTEDLLKQIRDLLAKQ
jgi:large conductance mechanosensitive channel